MFQVSFWHDKAVKSEVSELNICFLMSLNINII